MIICNTGFLCSMSAQPVCSAARSVLPPMAVANPSVSHVGTPRRCPDGILIIDMTHCVCLTDSLTQEKATYISHLETFITHAVSAWAWMLVSCLRHG